MYLTVRAYPVAMTWTAPDVAREPGPWAGGRNGHADVIRERIDGATGQ